jgi:hypothetical protein
MVQTIWAWQALPAHVAPGYLAQLALDLAVKPRPTEAGFRS